MFVTDVKIKATGDTKLNDSPDVVLFVYQYTVTIGTGTNCLS